MESPEVLTIHSQLHPEQRVEIEFFDYFDIVRIRTFENERLVKERDILLDDPDDIVQIVSIASLYLERDEHACFLQIKEFQDRHKTSPGLPIKQASFVKSHDCMHPGILLKRIGPGQMAIELLDGSGDKNRFTINPCYVRDVDFFCFFFKHFTGGNEEDYRKVIKLFK